MTNDVRGAVWTLGAMFMSRFTPNGSRDFYGVADPPGGGGDRLGDGFCVNDPGGKLPCVAGPVPLLRHLLRLAQPPPGRRQRRVRRRLGAVHQGHDQPRHLDRA